MIVTDDNISKALSYLAEDPHPVARARHDLTLAKNAKEALFAALYSKAEGTVRDKECAIERAEAYQTHKTAEAEAEFVLERHKARTRAAEMLIEVWRSENANARAAERVR
jgi:hypothetical protein